MRFVKRKLKIRMLANVLFWFLCEKKKAQKMTLILNRC